MKTLVSLLLVPTLALSAGLFVTSVQADEGKEKQVKKEKRIEIRREGPRGEGMPPGRMMWFEHLDDNAENIDPDELRERMRSSREARIREHFQDFDLDQSGKLTEAEMVEFMTNQAEERAKQLFRRLDTDGTGVISEDQFVERLSAMSEERRERVIIRRQEADERRAEAEQRRAEAMERMQQRTKAQEERRRERLERENNR
ncbi:EF-hand domain-containing protein [Aliidiomarina halalkaliphila]|uniref:EF-hand domain-containing protein n=1 Tax=Aliidiomarina halalkaliphila TaxID=2593535 RepID=A0A552X2W5_9GAMM|nr:EF-hand domain-containing protein [Aliidiomarina halalkaliphila]TRW48953.1 EF-hand domain-containing protein [Aliidiomarina halalkaliphila]